MEFMRYYLPTTIRLVDIAECAVQHNYSSQLQKNSEGDIELHLLFHYYYNNELYTERAIWTKIDTATISQEDLSILSTANLSVETCFSIGFRTLLLDYVIDSLIGILSCYKGYIQIEKSATLFSFETIHDIKNFDWGLPSFVPKPNITNDEI